MILTEKLSKKFDDFLAVDGVSLSVGKGEVLALLGPNGAGKTTTVRMLTSVLQPTSGYAEVAGYDGQASQPGALPCQANITACIIACRGRLPGFFWRDLRFRARSAPGAHQKPVG
jgi:ABC-type Na+ transport system ATPase subunit NatA